MLKQKLRTAARRAAAAALSCAAACSIVFTSAPAIHAEDADSDVAIQARVDDILSKMSTRQKIEQMIMVDFRKWGTTDDTATDFTTMNDEVAQIIADYDFGAVILFANNVQQTEQSYNLTMDLQKAAISDGGLPLLITIDQEGGSVTRLGTGTALPGNMALGATANTEDAKKVGEIIGSELSVLGINTDLAPSVDVNNNPNNPVIGLRSYGDDPVAVGEMASAEIAGMSEYNIIGCAKHFPGHGDVATDSHYGLPIVNKTVEEIKNNELKPYEVVIGEGIEMIMTAHILYPALDNTTLHSDLTNQEEQLPATLSKKIITDLLKGEMGFDGVVSTDAMNMEGVAKAWSQPQRTAVAMEAGADLICMPTVLYCKDDLKDLDAVIDYCEQEVQNGKLTEERLNDACTRILTLKARKGILDWKEDDYSLAEAKEVVGCAENKQAEREISARAVTVTRNNDDVLPMDVKADTTVLVATPYSNEPGLVSMAWNRGKEAETVENGAKLDYFVYMGETELTDEEKAKIDAADYVAAVTEVSRADRMGGNHWSSKMPNEIMNYAKSKGKKTIIISADKPYDTQWYPNADAVMAVYGNKGTGVDPTEAIIGGATAANEAYGPNILAGIEVALGTFGASGQLPVNVYKYDEDKKEYSTTDIVYKRGFGLTYQSKSDANRIEMYRLYNPNSGEHFYTSNSKERDYLAKVGWTTEGVGWIAPKQSKSPVYRLYNPNAGDHVYTLSSREKDYLVKAGWKDEGIGWYSDDKKSVEVWREYNPNAKAGSHNFTTNFDEHTYLVELGWKGEGVAWYGLENFE
ncbi:glycoside hydrolase family 3 N-terminal domain-containing protein [Allobaculum mucilyticum]|uniref:glycoside hydrolase family 3 N-terminal domain-containing protein n=1 Tax=Allobaculum mucilyticum TaxID=2834459 RepID=UPI001E61E395|nr:glycoside hydrolase family 3 N-terminal domain-containing protein [Allobaculum mucilyticum]UNT95590.1 hypothetical protein KWG62_09725 [Allobaculum mucilyticum]